MLGMDHVVILCYTFVNKRYEQGNKKVVTGKKRKKCRYLEEAASYGLMLNLSILLAFEKMRNAPSILKFNQLKN